MPRHVRALAALACCVLAPLAGIALGYGAWAAAQFGLGLLFWPVVMVLVFVRFGQAGMLPERLLPTLFIFVAPLLAGAAHYGVLWLMVRTIWTGDQIDLTKLPIVTHASKDCGPYVTIGMQMAWQPLSPVAPFNAPARQPCPGTPRTNDISFCGEP